MARIIVGLASPSASYTGITQLMNSLYFVRSGYISISSGRLRVANVHGYIWSRVASSQHYNSGASPSAYYLGFYATGVLPSYGPDYRGLAFPLRCLAAEGEAIPTIIWTIRRVNLTILNAKIISAEYIDIINVLR